MLEINLNLFCLLTFASIQKRAINRILEFLKIHILAQFYFRYILTVNFAILNILVVAILFKSMEPLQIYLISGE